VDAVLAAGRIGAQPGDVEAVLHVRHHLRSVDLELQGVTP
jgi:hypothetical protein